jgi:hypothetical protein
MVLLTATLLIKEHAMALEFRTVRLKKIGAEAADANKQWATLNLGFLDNAKEHFSGVKIQFVVPKDRNMTLRQLEEAARASALQILAEAHRTLSEASLEALEERQADIES